MNVDKYSLKFYRGRELPRLYINGRLQKTTRDMDMKRLISEVEDYSTFCAEKIFERDSGAKTIEIKIMNK